MALERRGAGCYVSHSQADTERLGELIATCLEDGDVLILTGGLGVGKTHLTKGVSRGLGDSLPVTSPTFALMAVHDGGRLPLFHFDLYRLEHAWELEDTGIYDVLGYEGACLLEWGERFVSELTDEYLSVSIERVAAGHVALRLDTGEPGIAAADAGSGDVEQAAAGHAIDERIIELSPHGERADALALAIDRAVTESLKA